MLITGFPAGMFATNCYVVAPAPGSEAIIIDPGQDSAPGVRKLLGEHSLTPVAVLLTHGHLDHTWNATELCDEYAIPAFIHPADRHMLADPAAGIGRALGAMIGDTVFREPEKVIDLADREDLDVAGLSFSVDLAPGHTQGSVLFGIDVDTPEGTVPVCFAGDVLFAGSIGRTDLPGGDHQQLRRWYCQGTASRRPSVANVPAIHFWPICPTPGRMDRPPTDRRDVTDCECRIPGAAGRTRLRSAVIGPVRRRPRRIDQGGATGRILTHRAAHLRGHRLVRPGRRRIHRRRLERDVHVRRSW